MTQTANDAAQFRACGRGMNDSLERMKLIWSTWTGYQIGTVRTRKRVVAGRLADAPRAAGLRARSCRRQRECRNVTAIRMQQSGVKCYQDPVPATQFTGRSVRFTRA